jgi:DnaK suppressor protein
MKTRFAANSASCSTPSSATKPPATLSSTTAFSAYSKELNFSLSDGERNLLMLIDEAFNRMKDGSYAVCTNCSVTIGEKRLQAVPWTPFCIDCQELQEKGMLQ